MRSAGPSEHRRTARQRAVAAVLVVAAALLTAGCDLRFETPPPAPLVPDQLEQVRQRVSSDALALEVLAGRAAAEQTDEGVRAVVELARTTSAAHLEVLGGIYDPTPRTADGTPVIPEDGAANGAAAGTPSVAATPAAADPATAQRLVDLLVETAASARADAAAIPDGPMARLLASVAVSRVLLADALVRTTGVEPPPGLAPTEALEPPTTAGLPSAAVAAVVQSQDALGLAWEVMAGRSADEARSHAAERAVLHRARAEAWAEAAGIEGTGVDPRRSWYDLPPELTAAATDPAVAQATLAALEGALAADYASLVSAAHEGTRSPLVDALLEASREHVARGGTLPTFPGLPERA